VKSIEYSGGTADVNYFWKAFMTHIEIEITCKIIMKIYNVIKKEYAPLPIFGMIVACGVFLCLVSFIFPSCNHGSAGSTPSGQIYAWEESVTLSAKEELLKENIDTFFQHKVQRAGLNGCVLVAAEGKILYRNCFGYGNYAAKAKLSDSSVFQLASVSKPFTATAVLLLSERGQLKLDEPVSTYLDAFPYPAITVRMLLNHRSGLMNYIYLFDTLKHQAKWYSNEDVVNYFAQQKPPLQARPNSKFQYCNTNYALLASIVAK
jgi:CubicO group peptidase (beta-lactamase class C family)